MCLLAWWFILQVKIDEGNVHRLVTRNRNRIIAVHIGWVVVRISRTFYRVINHRTTSCSRKGIYIVYIIVNNVQYLSTGLDMWNNLLLKAWYRYLVYFLLPLCFCNAVSLFYGQANKVHCCCCCCCNGSKISFHRLIATTLFRMVKAWQH